MSEKILQLNEEVIKRQGQVPCLVQTLFCQICKRFAHNT